MSRTVAVGGLAPSSSLAPSGHLAPASTVYGGGPITPNVITMAVGAGGAMVDVSAFVEYGEGISYRYGRETWFDDARPGTFSFTLNNSDGRFTPDNPGSVLATTLTEGMSVCWQLGTRLTHGAILSIEIPADETSWNHIVLTCDDMLGAAGRHTLTSLPDGLLQKQLGDVLWKLDDPSGSTTGAETYGDGLGPFTLHQSNPASTTNAVQFGGQAWAGLPGTTVTVTAAPGETNWFGTRFNNTMPVSGVTSAAVPAGQTAYQGTWNMWVYPGSTINLAVTPAFAVGPGYAYSMQIQVTPTTVTVVAGTAAGSPVKLSIAQQTVPHYLSMRSGLAWQSGSGTWALLVYLYIDGVYQNFVSWYDPYDGYQIPATAGSIAPLVVNVSVTNPAGATSNLSGTVARVSHTAQGSGLEGNALYNTLDQRRAVCDFIATEISAAAYNGPLSTSPIGYPSVDGVSILDVFNDIARSETGHLFCTTTGTVTAPTEQIQVRARDRPATVKAAFDVSMEGADVPAFVRDITNVAQQLQVTGPDNQVTVSDPTITGRYVANGLGETVLYEAAEDLREWGQDRLYRGRNKAVRAQTFTVDAVTTPTDRSTDLLGLVPGDRVQLTNTPVARLGFGTWDGWLIGGSETHTGGPGAQNRFQFTFTPALTAPTVFDTGLFAAGTDMTVVFDQGGPVSVNIPSGRGLASATLPYTVQIDREQLLVTAISSPVTVGSTYYPNGYTLTCTRGVNGTTTVVHSVGAGVELVPTAVFAY